MLKLKSQREYDRQRVCYGLTFPPSLSGDNVAVWLRAISGLVPDKWTRVWGMPTTVFETTATPAGIEHRLRLPRADAEYVVGQLRSLIPGINVTPINGRASGGWTAGISLGMTRPTRPLSEIKPDDMAASLLASIATLETNESVMIQWIITPAPLRAPARNVPTPSAEFSLKKVLLGSLAASGEEVEQRREKLDEHNVLAAGRIVAKAAASSRAQQLVSRVRQAMAGMHTSTNRFTAKTLDRYGLMNVDEARTPSLMPTQLSISESVGLLGWPIGGPFVPGLARGAARHLHATADIPSEGRILGHSNVPGHERPIALSYDRATEHLFVQGGSGSGKSVLLGNATRQDMANGYGVIVIDVGNSDSSETLFSRTLSYVPRERLDDVIIIDASKSWTLPVSLNILDQGNPRVVVDQVTTLFNNLYSETKGVWITRLLFHGLLTLAETPGYTFADLLPLLQPGKAEQAWSDGVRRQVKDHELALFWQQWKDLSASESASALRSLTNRIWQLTSRPETRYIIGQSKSAFQMDDVIRSNKILLVSLAGVPEDAATLLSALITDALWNAARRVTPEKPNFLYIDEAQLVKTPVSVATMLQLARKQRLGLSIATQEIGQLTREVQDGVLRNAATKIVFQAQGASARQWQQEMGRQYLTDADLERLDKYHAVAKVSTERGVSAPVTVRTLPPAPTTGVYKEAIARSDARYGRPVEEVRAEMEKRRMPPDVPPSKRPPISEI